MPSHCWQQSDKLLPFTVPLLKTNIKHQRVISRKDEVVLQTHPAPVVSRDWEGGVLEVCHTAPLRGVGRVVVARGGAQPGLNTVSDQVGGEEPQVRDIKHLAW